MAHKVRKNYSLDEGTVLKFQEICKKQKKEFSEVVEMLMEDYIAKDGQILIDDIYAPRMEAVVSRTMKKEIDRMAKMLYNINVDVTAGLYAFPALYKKTMGSVEDTFNHYVNEQLLTPNRQSLAKQFAIAEDGERIIQAVRNFARNDIKTRQQEKLSEQQK